MTDTWEKEGEGVLGPLYQHQEKKKKVNLILDGISFYV